MKHKISFLIVLLFSAISGVLLLKPQDSAAQDSKHLNLDVIAAWIPKSISVYHSAINPAEGHIYVALQAKPKGLKNFTGTDRAIYDENSRVVGLSRYPDEGGYIYSMNVVLSDSRGGKYIPIGCVSSGMAFFRNRSMLAETVQIEPSNESSADSKSLIYIYEIPVGRSGFKLTVGNSPPIPVEVIPR